MDKVTDKVYISDLKNAQNKELLIENGITHVISLVDDDKTSPELLCLQVADTEDQDILQHFSTSNKFIAEANGKVLVHCVSGISRSAAFVCAYLMQTNKWTSAQALTYLQSKRPVSAPNNGFLQQLDIFYKHGYEVDENAKLYREWKLKGPVQNVIYTRVNMEPFKLSWRNILPHLVKSNTSVDDIKAVQIDDDIYAVTEFVKPVTSSSIHLIYTETGTGGETKTTTKTISPEVLNEVLQKVIQRTYTYRCKGCSKNLASSSSLIRHDKGGSGLCQHFFIEPVEWMRVELELGNLEGKLHCFECSKKVGSYQWQGSKCSCGSWVTPAFKLNKDKVDEMVVRKA